jgi:putative restriction endonuclease
MRSERWSKDQLKLAFHLYCQLPFGQLHQRNPEIVDLARLIKRSPGAVAMKLVNFASLDPAIVGTGRRGLSNASDLDREVWNEFHADWDGLTTECDRLRAQRDKHREPALDAEFAEDISDYRGETRKAVVQQRVKQQFFRRAVLSSYGTTCCMTGISEPRLLIASHIKPWSVDKSNRLNPRNGLCLSALHDRAFDQGFLTVTPELRILVSPSVARMRDNKFVVVALQDLDGTSINSPSRFHPDPGFLAWHYKNRFMQR